MRKNYMKKCKITYIKKKTFYMTHVCHGVSDLSKIYYNYNKY